MFTERMLMNVLTTTFFYQINRMLMYEYYIKKKTVKLGLFCLQKKFANITESANKEASAVRKTQKFV